MMLRILSNHPEIHTLNELHFFEQLWSTSDTHKELTGQLAAELASKLLFVQRDGYIGKTQVAKYLEEGHQIIQQLGNSPLFGHSVLIAMMNYETALNNRSIPCEKTPQNVFYLAEILSLYPNARIINMIRDPRAVMLSQKRKWRRRKMGATFITPWEVFRLRVNYHPITLSKLWNSAIKASIPFREDERVMTVHFEDILNSPQQTAKEICDHLRVEYLPPILNIPQASSSNEADSREKGINKERAGNWKKGGLHNSEIYWCQKISGTLMVDLGYEMELGNSSLIMRAWYAFTFPFKIGLALLLNLNRMKNIGETLKKRLGSS